MATSSTATSVGATVARPEKFCGQCNIETWIKQFELYLTLTNTTDDGVKRNLILSYLDITVYEAVIISGQDSTYVKVSNFLIDRYSTRDKYMDRIKFFSSKYSGSPESFAAEITNILDSYDLPSFKEQLLVAKFIDSSTDQLERELRMRRPSTVNECVKIANSLSTSALQCNAMDSNRRSNSNKQSRVIICVCCGKKGHKPYDPLCPSRDKECHMCGKKGHFMKMCQSRKKTLQTLPVSQMGKNDAVYPRVTCLEVMNLLNLGQVRRPEANVRINHVELTGLVDSGSNVSVLSKNHAERLNLNIHYVSDISCNNGDGSSFPIYGYCDKVSAQFKNRTGEVIFLVGNVKRPIFGMDTVAALRMVIDTYEPDSQISVIHTGYEESSSVVIPMKDSAPDTCIQRVRRLPFTLEKQVEDELQSLIARDIIEPIEYSEYVSPIVVAPKPNGKIRLCVDFRKVNQFIVVDQFPMPSADEIFVKLNGSKWFSKIDLTSAYHQLSLAPESRHITAFITHCGLFRFKVLPYGLASAPAIFTRKLKSVIGTCNNTVSYIDDILVFGSSKDEHDLALANVKKSLENAKLVINEEKSLYGVQSLEYLGRTISSNGIEVSKRALKSLREMPSPTNKAQLRSVLGMFGFYRQYVPHFAAISSTLFDLVKENVPFDWEDKHERTFKFIKEEIEQALPLAYFNTSLNTKTYVTCDGSADGLGAMLSQVSEEGERPVYFISRKTTENEKKFSASELETLAVIWAIERFHQFVYGREFTLRTDHKCLSYVLNGAAEGTKAPARIVRWAYRLLPYTFDVVYLAGKMNTVADALSRRPVEGDSINEESTSLSILSILRDTEAIRVPELVEATLQDDTLQKIKDFVLNGWTGKSKNDDVLKPYYHIRDEISVIDGVLCRGEKVIVPAVLRGRLIMQAHFSHSGIVKMKSNMRQLFWWPGMDGEIERHVRQCSCFQETIPRDTPVQNVEWPNTPFTHLALDIAGPKTDRDNKQFYILVVIDYHSRYIITRVYYKPITSRDIIELLRSIFATYGYCLKITTDNGSVFVSLEMKNFLRINGISHICSSLYNPQSNGLVERVNRNLKKVLANNAIGKANAQEILDEYAFSYNNSEHETLKRTPASLIFGYRPRAKFAMCVPIPEPSEEILQLGERIKCQQRKKASYADERRRPRLRNPFKSGDVVQNRQGRVFKLAEQIGPYTFRLSNGSSLNIRHLRLISDKRNSKDQDVVPVYHPNTTPRRYPTRARKEPERYKP